MAPRRRPPGPGRGEAGTGATAPRVVVCQDREDLVRRGAEVIAAVLAAAAPAGLWRVALAGGSTPRPVYQRLAGLPLAWDRIEWFWGDERCVPPDHPDSNYRMAREALFDRLPSPPEPGRVHRMRGEDPDPAAAATSYAAELVRSFGLAPGAVPRFDLILLGMGAEGHTASLFPDSPALRGTGDAAPVAAVEAPGLGWRLTLTPAVLRRAARLVFMAAGRDKAEALRDVLEGPDDPLRRPAQVFRASEGSVTWLVDREAAALLARRRPPAGPRL